METDTHSPRIAIVGAGLSGMCIAIKLKESGFQDIVIYEKARNVGGTWRENTYPGVACDVPSHLYSYSFEAKPDWSSVFSPGAEIQRYCEHVAEKYRLLDHVQYAHELTQAVYERNGWRLKFANGLEATADFLISAIGGLHIPNYPQINGAETFQGATFHSAKWDHNLALSNKRVAVIGTAASALQLIPEIVDKVAQLDVYQRTPNWVMPRPEGAYKARTKKAIRRLPFLGKLLRLWLYSLYEMRVPLFRGNRFFASRAERMARDHIAAQVTDFELRAKLTPDYSIGCKRILASDTYFPALQKDHVELVTDGIREITANGIMSVAGEERTADVIIWATGFKPFDVACQMEVIGRDGESLEEYMKDGIRAHRTVAVPGFPNYFMMLGPNSGLGHNSIIIIIEAQAKYIVQAIERTMALGAQAVEAKSDITEAFNDKIQNQLRSTVWAGHCKSWYQDAGGRIYTLWPRGTINFRRSLARFDPNEYVFDR